MSGRARTSCLARLTLAALAGSLAAAGLGGCPLPQPLPELGRVDGGTVTPPRIVVDPSSLTPIDSVVRVSVACPLPGPRFELRAEVDDPNTTEAVDARWFVDYDPLAPSSTGAQALDSPPPVTAPATRRPVQPFVFAPPAYDPAAPVHVVELVVSNGFMPLGSPNAALPNRSAELGFEVQVYRWVFQYDPASQRCAD